jgi:thiamine-phosphate pyrophosphorylase
MREGAVAPRFSLCLITDRRRLCAALQRPLEDGESLVLQQIAGAVRGGVDLVQIRETDLDSGPLAALVRGAVQVAAGSRTRVVVNDRIDVAIAASADGVHLRERSVATADARRIAGPRMLIGRSVHRPEAAAAAGAVDYLIAGTVFATASKPAAQALLGVDGLSAVVRAAGERPVFAIGGMGLDAVAIVRAAGARGLAAIGLFIPSGPVADLAWTVEEITKTVRFSFDTPAELP